MTVYDKQFFPKRLHYAFNDRIDNVPALMAESWQLEL